ncbi:dTDP-4-dehydrorhamnose reductase [Salinimicrobium sp. TH3]|uniref:dTDP-4-dehydrorhamnose reductase n=1 Tax=Salinimicrobium sp. TH3 TaxID=2997342 RepID=UPI002273511E|nr:dTDP-4-dehydrorhamnose reductase [Salinimicrobium sp. TH3]MCY2686546.1 dTDP-4-dehydrorhamnose reductase [Salinimicrobium sp. TH3]
MKILITGAGGQLGKCFKQASLNYPGHDFNFTTSDDLDLSQFAVVGAFMRREKFDICINCAAYTNVEKAEKEQEMAYLINSESVRNLARDCDETGCTLIHISTDYVFNGKKDSPYTEEDATDPLNVYGASKLLGEEYIQEATKKYLIFRTSWLYSNIGKNFFTTIKAKAEAGETLNITTSQKGTPTNAHDLAAFVLEIIAENKLEYGLYHYSNLGEATWYDFAKEILTLMNSGTELNENNDYQTLAVRPAYSVLSKQKVQDVFKLPIPHWKESLKELYQKL